MNPLYVFVPAPGGSLSQTLAPGSAIVGLTPAAGSCGHLRIGYEGNLYGAVNLRRFVERLKCAGGREVTGCATSARCLARESELELVGYFQWPEGPLQVIPSAASALALWLAPTGERLDESNTCRAATIQGVTEPERAAILAGLRLLQRGPVGPDLMDIRDRPFRANVTGSLTLFQTRFMPSLLVILLLTGRRLLGRLSHRGWTLRDSRSIVSRCHQAISHQSHHGG